MSESTAERERNIAPIMQNSVLPNKDREDEKEERSEIEKEEGKENPEEKDEEDEEDSGSESSDDNSEEARIQQQKETDEAAHTLVHEVGK